MLDPFLINEMIFIEDMLITSPSFTPRSVQSILWIDASCSDVRKGASRVLDPFSIS